MNLFDLIFGQRQKTDESITANQSSVIALATSVVRQPVWMSPHPVSEVSWPQIFMSQTAIFGNTGAQSTGTAHTHSFSGFTAYTAPGLYGISANNSGGAYVTATSTFTADTILIYAQYGTLATTGTVQLQLYVENSDTSLSLITDQNIRATLTTTPELWQFDIGHVVLRQGVRYLIRVANKSNQSVFWDSMSVGAGPWAFETTGSTLNNQTSFTAAEVAAANASATIIPWACIAQTQFEVEDKVYTDPFTRDNIGNSWYVFPISGSTTAKLSLVNYQLTNAGANSTFGEMIYLSPTNTDGQRVDFDVYNLTGTGAAATALINRSFSGSSSGCGLVLTPTQARIRSLLAGSYTTQATVSIEGGDGTWAMYYDVAANTYTVLFNGADIGLSWTDSSNVVPHTAANRHGGLLVSKGSSGAVPQIDNWQFRDWTP